MTAKPNPALTRMIRELPRLQNYSNTTKVMTIKGQSILVEGIIKAGLISRSNELLLGARGRGKTTLEHDVIDGFFGGKGTYIRAHPKMDEKELFSRLNLGKYLRGEVESSKELREIVEAIHNNCIVVDEITRLPGISQNRIFGLADGYIELEGVRYPIGNGYSVVISSGNVGDNYTGTFILDDALIDRFPVILNLDDYSPQPQDSFLRLIGKHDPRVPDTEKHDYTDKLKAIYGEIKKMEASVMMAITAEYLISALGDCSKRGFPKLMMIKAMPRACEGCGRLADGCGYYQGLSERAGEAVVGFTLALQQIAIAKHEDAVERAQRENTVPPVALVNDDINDVLEVFKTFTGHTGILNTQWVMQKHLGNPYLFMKELVVKVKQEFDDKVDDLSKIINAIENGDNVTENMLKQFTDDVSAGAGSKIKNPWRFVKGLVGV